jgi:Mn2+/Fe2+ NRAMP family transporter
VGLSWVVASVALLAAFTVAAGGPATSPVGVVGATVASLLAVFLEPSSAVLLPGLFLLVVAMAQERYRGAAVAAVLSTAVVLVGAFVALVMAGDVTVSGGPAVDPTQQGPVALLAIPGLLPVVAACLAATVAPRERRPVEPPHTYRARRTIP